MMGAVIQQVVEPEVRTPSRLRMTEEEFVAWCDEDVKAEWVDGEVIVHSPANVRHVELTGLIVSVMRAFAEQRDLGRVLGPEFQIRFGPQRRRRVPDILFVAKARLDIIQTNHIEGAPDLVMEIVSPDSPARDWRDKYLEYKAAGVREYWVIDPMAEQMEAYALGEDGHYARIDELEEEIAELKKELAADRR